MFFKTKSWSLILLTKIIVIGLLFFLLWRTWDYTKHRNFPIKQVKIISACEHVDKKILQNTIESYAANGFFHLNAIGMKQQLLKMPWVYAISVQRKWPDTIIVNVVEQKAVLQWGDKSLVNDKGDVFIPPISTFPKELPVIFGPEEKELEIFALYQKAKQQFEPLDLSIKKIFLNPQHHWEILLSNNTMVYLKENDPLKQIKFLVDLYKRITASHDGAPKTIDLRYNTNGLAIKWS